jgi:hypothetical protein
MAFLTLSFRRPGAGSWPLGARPRGASGDRENNRPKEAMPIHRSDKAPGPGLDGSKRAVLGHAAEGSRTPARLKLGFSDTVLVPGAS